LNRNISVVIDRVLKHIASHNPEIDASDGPSRAFDPWRFNLPRSNTEPLLRLNLETGQDEVAVKLRAAALEALIQGGS
jgi:phosphomannomutase/phosphomannomutase/phosphoglucomutase